LEWVIQICESPSTFRRNAIEPLVPATAAPLVDGSASPTATATIAAAPTQVLGEDRPGAENLKKPIEGT
jgi:hypothetical protein